VRFKHQRGPGNSDGLAVAGVLEIPLPAPSEEKPGWIVDGQQRTLALSKAKRHDIAVPVVAFVADTVDVQRDQFVRINSAKPLPSGLVTELLPQISVPINPRLAAKKLPSALVEQLNTNASSPFRGIIRRASSTQAERKSTVVTDTSLVNALEESLTTPGGSLFPYRNVASGETDIESIWLLLIAYWTAVQTTFPEAWGKRPTQSRLMHGVGIRSMSRLMDRVISAFEPDDKDLDKKLAAELAAIASYCHWTSGTWDELGLRWNELQNVPKHIRLLSNHLIRLYMQHRRDAR
jgi:DGQHR domain-containing protein